MEYKRRKIQINSCVLYNFLMNYIKLKKKTNSISLLLQGQTHYTVNCYGEITSEKSNGNFIFPLLFIFPRNRDSNLYTMHTMDRFEIQWLRDCAFCYKIFLVLFLFYFIFFLINWSNSFDLLNTNLVETTQKAGSSWQRCCS